MHWLSWIEFLVIRHWFAILITLAGLGALLFKRKKLESQERIPVLIAWFASILALPVYFFVLSDVDLSASPPPPPGGVMIPILMGVGPVTGSLALMKFFRVAKLSIWKIALLIVPTLLIIGEFLVLFLLS
jgi:hypothetical protein